MKQGWEIKKLGDITTSINGLWTGKKPPFITIAVIRNTNFTKDCKLDTSDIAYIDVEVKQYASRKLQCGDIIIEKSGGSDKQPVGRPILFNIEEGEYSFSNFTSTLRVSDKTTILPEFIHRYLAYIYMRGGTAAMQSKTTGIRNLDFNLYKSINIPIPPREEQEKIVAELDCLSGIIERKREQLRELDALAQSIFYQMFGDPNTNDRNWNVVKLNTTCDNLDYQRRPITAKDRIEGNIPYYGASGVVDYVQDYIFDGDYLLVSEDGANLEVRHTPIAFSIKGKTWVNNHAHILKFEHYCTQLFMEYYINLLDISDIITGCAQPKLTQANLNSINVFDISIEKQQEFADKIEAIEKQKELIKKSISETETLFNARMDYYFN